MSDLLLKFRISLAGWQLLALRIHVGRGEPFVVQASQAQNQLVLRRGDDALSRADLAHEFALREVMLELACCDQQIIVAIDQREVLRHAVVVSDEPLQPTTQPLAIGVIAAAAQVRDLQIFRDLHYLDPAGIGIEWSADRPLGEDEYIVLGDNVPISMDSRHWLTAGVPRKLLVGKVLEGSD